MRNKTNDQAIKTIDDLSDIAEKVHHIIVDSCSNYAEIHAVMGLLNAGITTLATTHFLKEKEAMGN